MKEHSDNHFLRLFEDEYLKPSELTIEDLAEKIHTNPQYLREIIEDGRKLSFTMSRRLGWFFGKPAEYFYDLQDELDAEKRTEEISLTGIQSNITISALDLYSRIWMGQYDHMSFDCRFLVKPGSDWKLVDENELFRNNYFLRIRAITLPECDLGLHGSYGIWSPKTDIRAVDAYDMQQIIRYKLSYYRQPEGGNTVNFNEPMIEGRFPRIVCDVSGSQESPVVRIKMNKEQFGIVYDALHIYDHFVKGEYRNLFGYYTNDETALHLAEECEHYNNKNTRKIKGLTQLLKKLDKVQDAQRLSV